MKKTALICLFAALLCGDSFGQKLLSEINIGTNGMFYKLKGMPTGEGVFLKFDLFEARLDSTYHVGSNGVTRSANLEAIKDKVLFALAIQADSSFYYFLEENKKTVMIRSLAVHRGNGKGQISNRHIDLPGRLYGTYVENGDLFLLCALKGSFTLRLAQVHGMQLLKETNFVLPFDLGRNKRATVSFVERGSMENLGQSTASIKIFRERQCIWIAVDEPFPSLEPPVAESAIFKTSIIKLDLATGESSNRVFFESARVPFSSTVFNNTVYRIVNENGIRVDMIDFETSKTLHTYRLLTNIESKPMLTSRSASALTVKREPMEKSFFASMQPSFIMADTLENGNLILTIGKYFQEGPAFYPVAAFGMVGVIASSIVSMALRDLTEGPFEFSYLYLTGSREKGFALVESPKHIRRVIDDYELQKQTEQKIKYKGYISDHTGVYGIYKIVKSENILVVKYSMSDEI